MKKLYSVFPEILHSSPFWKDLFDSIEEVWRTQFELPTEELINIRNVTHISDEQLLLNTLRMLGYNITKDTFNSSKEDIKKSVAMLGLYHEINGTEDFYKFIEFLTKREVSIQNLYTNNYADFYPSPYGAKIEDGGDWYRTTHYNVWLGELDVDRIKQVSDYEGYIKELLGIFYEYSPANLVVHRFGLLKRFDISAFLTGSVTEDKFEINHYPGLGTLTGISIVGDLTVDENTEHVYKVRASWSSGSITTEYSSLWNSDNLRIANISRDGRVHYGFVETDTQVQLDVIFMGMTTSATITVVRTGASRELEFITIVGAGYVDGGNNVTLYANGHYSNGEILPIDPEWVLVHPFANVLSNGIVETASVTEDIDVFIEARKTSVNGVQITGTHKLTILTLDTGLTILYLQINGPSSLSDNSSGTYTVTAHYSDGSSSFIIPRWNLLASNNISISTDGVITVGNLTGSFTAYLEASVTYRGVTYHAQKAINVTYSPIYVTQLFINGPSYVTADQYARYTVTATWSDGSFTTIDSPEWQVSKYSINSNGELSLIGVSIIEPIVVSAKFTDPAGNLNITNRTVTVAPFQLQAESITIIGPTTVREGVSAQYSVYVDWNNGTQTLASNAVWSVSETFATIDNNGIFSFNNPSSTSIIVEAAVSVGSSVLTNNILVILIPNRSKIVDLIISGPTQMNEDEQAQFTATALMDDGSSTSVSPVWSTSVVFPNINASVLDDGPVLDVSTNGLVLARRVREDTESLLVATYFGSVASQTITVKNVPESNPNTVDSHRIDGPSVFYTSDVASYAQMITFNGRGVELAVSSTWSIDVPPSVAVITEDGYLLPRDDVDATITITATYSCMGLTITDTLIVTMRSTGLGSGSIQIHGQSAVSPNTSVSYTSIYTAADGSTQDVTGQVVWSVISTDGVSIDIDGNVTVPNVGVTTTFIVKAELTQGFVVMQDTKIVTIQQALPVYGLGPIGLSSDAEITQYLTNSMPDRNSGNTFTLNAGPAQYMYFAHTTDLGLAVFIDVATTLEGGMDGATWPNDGSIGATTGPLQVTRVDPITGTTQDWYLYRSDFGGLGNFTFQVNYI